MRKITTLIFTILFALTGYSQQFPLQSQYQYNYSVINPAVVVENDYTSMRASFRQQWVGFSDNPIATQLFTINRGFGKNGLGATIFNDETGGAFSKSGISLSYAHKVRFSTSELYLGVSGGAAKVNLSNIGDPSVINSEDFIPEVTFGAFYKIDDFRIGMSVPGLLNANMELTNSKDNIVNSHLYTMLSYDYSVNDFLSLHPALLVKTTKSNNQVDANLNLKIKDKLWVGASYRQDFGPSVYLGIDFGKLFSIYSHDISTNEVSSYANGSHEFTIGYDLNPALDSTWEKSAVKVEEFLFDKDKDGVKDSMDLCPVTFGSVNAHGCPDTDGDGIPNDFDLCPNLYGEIEMQGCPEITQFEKNIIYKALNDLKFDFDKAEINYSSYPTLTDITMLLLKNQKMFLHITGYSSSEGSEEYNLGLSARRAKAVQNFFKGRGIKKSRLILDYFGEESPLNNNQNEDEKAENRRVEFSLEYHIFDIDESYSLRLDYKNLLKENGLDYSFLDTKKPVIKKKEYYFEKKKESKTNILDKKSEVVETIPNVEETVEETVEDIADVIDALNNFDLPVEEEVVEEKVIEASNSSEKYILVIAVLSSKQNADSYIKKNPSANYEFSEGRYYIYEDSNSSKDELKKVKLSYTKDSWIKKIR
ncbi:PorP/SprF family type IX secretion system membrane protein [Flavobacteriales bacterium]|nr:PorP/SprF family type IX secretion system membrane protein [Flavobacteriales bacterium]MDC1063603.1 PorP/SprF family type IX secretion system membrane protein [Flavobacteriales bacterium]